MVAYFVESKDISYIFPIIFNSTCTMIKLQQENRQLRDDLSCLREEMNEMEEKFEEQLRLALRDSEMSAQNMKSKDDRSVCLSKVDCTCTYVFAKLCALFKSGLIPDVNSL